jgi:YD repeat-containing protein
MLSRLTLSFLLFALASQSTQAAETITYNYDALGRLTKVAHSGAINNGASECYSYDRANNRSNVTSSTTSDCSPVITLALSPTSLLNGTVGAAYSQTITASGGTAPYTFSNTSGSLPAGLNLSSAGVLSGTPTTASSYSFSVTANDSASHSGSQSYNITVGASASSCNGVSFSVNSVSANEGSPLTFTITKAGSTSATCTVSYATANGTAVAGTNYQAIGTTLASFAPSATTIQVQVTTYDDGVYHSTDRYMYLNLSSPSSGATLTNTQGTGTLIEMDDPNPCPLC